MLDAILQKIEDDNDMKIAEFDVSDTINNDKTIEEGDFAAKAEMIAFSLSENFEHRYTDWNTYFGPRVMVLQDNTVLESPPKEQITGEVYSYWQKRYHEAKHPILRARYAGLLFDFAYHCTGKNADYKFVPEYITALLDAVDSRLFRYQTSAFIKIDQAISLAIKYNLPELLERSKKVLFQFEKEIPDDHPGLWINTYDLLIKKPRTKLTDEEEKQIIDDLEGRFTRLTTKSANRVFDPHSAEAAVEALVEYYNKAKREEEIKRIVSLMGKAYENQIDESTGFQAMSRLQRLHKFYSNFKFVDDAERILVRIRKQGPEYAESLSSHEFKVELPKEKVDEFIEANLAGSAEEILANIATNFIPNAKQAELEVQAQAKVTPFQFTISRDIIDKTGRIVSVVNSISEDLPGHVAQRISHNIGVMSLFLSRVFELGIMRKTITADSVIAFMKKSAAFTIERHPLLERGIQAYFDNDYITSVHVLIPQIEEGCRHILEVNGINTWATRDGRSYQVKLFEKILREEDFGHLVSDDIAQYFRVLFTDQRGWNLRNDVCHGISDMNSFNIEVANRVIHSVLTLALVRLRESQ